MAKNILSNAVTTGASNGAETLLLEKVQDVLLDTRELLHDLMSQRSVATRIKVNQIAARTVTREIEHLLGELQAAGIAIPMGGRIVHRETDPDDAAYTDLNN